MATSPAHPFGTFAPDGRTYRITDPVTPRPWINYLGNRRLRAFISQNAGGLLWHHEPFSRRITRYHYTAAPGDRPGFYLYLRDPATGTVWNPHFAPSCTPLDAFECLHEPGVTTFRSTLATIEATVACGIPPADDVLLWHVTLRNTGPAPARLDLATYMEFGLLEFMREAIGWCYLKNHFSLRFDPALNAIRYDYHVFEAPYCPRMLFGSTASPDGWECSRDAFIGRTGSLERPASLAPGATLSNSDLPLGGHACAVLGHSLHLPPGDSTQLGFIFALADDWDAAAALLTRYRHPGAIATGLQSIRAFWSDRLDRTAIHTPDPLVDRAVNTWIPYNAAVALDLARTVSTDHMGTDGLRYRDTTQDALAVANVDPEFAAARLRQVFAQQTADGGGCFAFFPDDKRPTQDAPHRSDNTVWQIYTVANLVAETGEFGFLDEVIPFRDSGRATVYEHILRGLRHIHERRGPRGLPTLFHADWNDGLALWRDERAESVMLGMQLVYSCRCFAELADRLSRDADARWCRDVVTELTRILNSELVWDGRWYRRLLLSNGKHLGGSANAQGKIFLNPQSWAVISGVGQPDARGRTAMESAAERLDSPAGLRILDPPFTGIPEPTDPPLGSNPGIGENGGIFCHANTWAIIAEALLGNAERAFRYFRQQLPEAVSDRFGQAHYQREPYVYASSIVGPRSERFGEGGISWLTGTANWMHVAAVQYLLGIRPTYDGLALAPCLPAALAEVRVTRLYRGCRYAIALHREGRPAPDIRVNGAPWSAPTLPIEPGATLDVEVRC